MALLEALAERTAGGSLLTLATTHHGELKTLKYRDTRFENASVEFDEERMRPTFRLLWGIPGRSNALSIAERLGLPGEIIAEARRQQGRESAEVNEVILEMEVARKSFEKDVTITEKLAIESESMLADLTAAARRLEQHELKLRFAAADTVSSVAEQAMAQLRALAHSETKAARQRAAATEAERRRQQSMSEQSTNSVNKDRESRSGSEPRSSKHRKRSPLAASSSNPFGGLELLEIDNLSEQGQQKSRPGAKETGNERVQLGGGEELKGAGGRLSDRAPGVWTPSEGETVYVPKLGTNAQVKSVNSAKGTVSVLCGFMAMVLKLSEVQSLTTARSSLGSKRR
eukprot:TRINITY_DN17967_c0_g1_i1.p1 TRINITY_DN17967_c0_g1~~TRINITY_DN17967_c0_g1_i1.p1  ORF type:complete len:343 (-),score=48.95 TRINITY_DN17967_c0_g1_i1:467-1495(-)